MNELHHLLLPGGILYLGVPVSGNKGYVEGNYHRFYSYDRFYALIKDKFTILYAVEDHVKFYNQEMQPWPNQPLLVLQKIN